MSQLALSQIREDAERAERKLALRVERIHEYALALVRYFGADANPDAIIRKARELVDLEDAAALGSGEAHG